jgi:hypothetical protein
MVIGRGENMSSLTRRGFFKVATITTASTLLANSGGIITLLNQNGTKIDGVSYTKTETEKEDWTILFTK